ncbi:squalene synthase [Phellopilus nigrolimitatus]|nr:squalene synthase [Phellopilus nigrolimitatus]
MGATDLITLLFTHPNEFRTLMQFWIYHEQRRDITSTREHETSGWDRPTMKRCWHFLDMTSRSFSAVIKELDGDLARVICLFYLVLRGLDTVEDDMTIPNEVKQPLLRSFHEKVVTPGWNFNGCGPREKDRQLLVEFDCVVTELNLLPPAYLAVIVDICREMAVGMADYAHKAHKTGVLGLDTVADVDLGLSRVFAASGKEQPWLGEQLVLSNHMGLLLQKTNILRDFREDVDDGRLFWPREIWGAYGFDDPKDMCKPANSQRALWALSGMTLDALRHAVESLDYLTLLKNQTVFNFCAIPQSMALATLSLCFMNPAVFQRNVKIRKAEAARLIMRSTNPREVALIFREYARVIHAKSVPTDPNFLRISVACGKIEQWCEHHYPSFVTLGTGGASSLDPTDARTRIAQHEEKVATQVLRRRRIEAARRPGAKEGPVGPVQDFSTKDLLLYVGGIFLLILALALFAVWVMIRFFA